METSNFQNDRFGSNIAELSRRTESLSIQDNPTSPKICFSYSKHGHCKFGHNCKFLHRLKKSNTNEFMHNNLFREEFDRFKNMRKETEISVERTITEKHSKAPFASDSHLRNLSKRPCRYFQAGYCSKDKNCFFSHSTKDFSFHFSNPHAVSNSAKLPSHSTKKKSVPICYYFKRGACHKGDDCKYYHQQRISVRQNSNVSLLNTSNSETINSISSDAAMSSTVVSKENESCSNDSNHVTTGVNFDGSATLNSNIDENVNLDSNYTNENRACSNILNNVSVIPNCSAKLLTNAENKVPCRALKLFDLPLSGKELLQLREMEITQLKKRYPVLKERSESMDFTFEFNPSDPDWSHDVSSFQLQIMFPENYPLEVCKINVLQSTDIISEIILRHLNEKIFDWLTQRQMLLMKANKVELLFRPFHRWFDKNLDELFSSGLQKVKQCVFSDTDDSGDLPNETQPFLSGESVIPGDLEILHNGSPFPENQDDIKSQVQEMKQPIPSEPIKSSVPTYTAQKLGVNILFMGLELIEGVAALSCTKLALMLHCGRCKTSINIKTIPNKNNSITCAKCSKILQCNFNPSIIHQFTNVLGTVYLVECQGVDVNLVESAFLVDCLNCSKQVSIQGIHYGPKQKFYCMFCNQKLVISIESSKFQSSSVTYTSVKTVSVKKTEKKKNPSIKEGGPLPQLGACKHYKKSNRWLRFPCCGRVYPCDLCHEEKESDHEMKFASRMICGFCSKEQPYSKDKPCSGCSSNVTAKSGAHWEGGKGCRNKIKMARDDKKKYAGYSKTISNKSQNSGKKKK